MKAASPVHPGVQETAYKSRDPDVLDLPVVRGPDGTLISRWELTEEDRARIAAGGSIYLWVWTFGHALQPVCVTTECPFVEEGPAS